LKAKSGWNDNDGNSGNGEDKFGFTAMPGGYSVGGNNFSRLGRSGLFWSATWKPSENNPDDDNVYYRGFVNNSDVGAHEGKNKTYWFNIRCIKNETGFQP